MRNTVIPKWFDGVIYDEGGTVVNPYSNRSYELNNVELSIYDYAIGLQFYIDRLGGVFDRRSIPYQKKLRMCLDWFRRNNAEAYMVLLD